MKTHSKHEVDKTPKTHTPRSFRAQIELRAYQIWISSGRNHGNDLQHWLQAEAEILKNGEKDALAK